MKAKRVLLYVHFNENDSVDDYVVYQLKKMKPVFSKIIFISNSCVSDRDKRKLVGLYDEFLQRNNKGYDFAAWRDGIKSIGWDKLQEYGSMTLMNDTCFGPTSPLEAVYRKMEKKDIDFWGATNHPEYYIDILEKNLPKHIQSYFTVYKDSTIKDPSFRRFWDNITEEKDVQKVIDNYEVSLTGILIESGLKYDVIFDTAKYIDENHIKITDSTLPFANFMNTRPLLCCNKGVPFIKKKAISQSIPETVTEKNTFERLQKNLKIDAILYESMKDSINGALLPNKTLFLLDKTLKKPSVNRVLKDKKIAIQLHAHYLDIAEQYFRYFSEYNNKPDLFVSTNSAEKAEKVKRLSKKYKLTVKEILITENKGRDIIPFIKMMKKMNGYDIAGHFHTKKSLAETTGVIGKIWQDEIFDNLVKPDSAEVVLNNFYENKKLGIIIPDIPDISSKIQNAYLSEVFPQLQSLKPHIKRVVNSVGLEKEIPLSEMTALIFPYGTMFWYRPSSLEKLAKMHINEDEIPSEPLPANNITLLHALERIPVYVAWDAGYDYRIVKNKKNNQLLYQYNLQYNDLINDLIGKEYRAGKIFVSLIHKARLGRVTKKTYSFLKKMKNRGVS